MKETQAILQAYDQARAALTPCALATVVHVEGSSYRRAGARMLVDEHGQMTGAISGGCLEGDALRKALLAIHQRQNKLVTYDTSDENDAIIGAQLGCNGVIQVLFEFIDFAFAENPVELLRMASASKASQVLVTLFNLKKMEKQPGTTLLITSSAHFRGKAAPAPLMHALLNDATAALKEEVSQFREYRDGHLRQQAFIEVLTPPLELVLVGAGNDAQLMAQMADLLGWQVTVTDGRPTHANADRFGSSCQILVSRPEAVLEKIMVHSRTVFVLMTHNYRYDLAVLRLLLPKMEVPYIGILGPKVKFQRMLDDLKADGIVPTPEQLTRVFAPVGLDLGADSPAEIALSILAEIQAVTSHTDGSRLRERTGPIHKRKNNEFKIVEL